MNASLIIDDSDFLGSAIIVKDVQDFTDRDLELFRLMEACVMLSDFAKE
jgi:hypothetical protein